MPHEDSRNGGMQHVRIQQYIIHASLGPGPIRSQKPGFGSFKGAAVAAFFLRSVAERLNCASPDSAMSRSRASNDLPLRRGCEGKFPVVEGWTAMREPGWSSSWAAWVL